MTNCGNNEMIRDSNRKSKKEDSAALFLLYAAVCPDTITTPKASADGTGLVTDDLTILILI